MKAPSNQPQKPTLKLEYLAPYLPYGLKLKSEESDVPFVLVGLDSPYKYSDKAWLTGVIREPDKTRFFSHVFNISNKSEEMKPLLHPVSHLFMVIKHNNKEFVPIDKLEELYGQTIIVDGHDSLIFPITMEPYILFRQLLEWHFDVFNLIKQGLALPIELHQQNNSPANPKS